MLEKSEEGDKGTYASLFNTYKCMSLGVIVLLHASLNNLMKSNFVTFLPGLLTKNG